MPSKRQKAAQRNARQQANGEGNNADDNDIGVHEQRFAWLLAPVRDLAENWKIDIAHELENYLAELEHVVISVDRNEERGRVNFVEAALLIQGSTCVYSKKVEYLYQLCYQLLQTLTRQRAARDNQPDQETAGDGNVRDRVPRSVRRRSINLDEDIVPLNNFREGRRIDMVDKRNTRRNFTDAAARTNLVRPPMPLALIPLEEAEKSPVPLVSASGDSVGRRDDFWVNSSKMHPASGTLLLDACNLRLADAVTSHETFARCAASQTFEVIDIDPNYGGGDGEGRGGGERRGEGERRGGGDEGQGEGEGPCQTPLQISPNAPSSAQLQREGPVQQMETTTFGVGDVSFGDDDDQNDDFTMIDPVTRAAASSAVPPPVDQDLQEQRFELPSIGVRKKQSKLQMLQLLEDPWEELGWDDEREDIDPKDLRVKPFKKGRPYRVPTVPGTENGEVPVLNERISDFLNACIHQQSRTLPQERWKRPSTEALDDIYWQERKRRTTTRLRRRPGTVAGINPAPPAPTADTPRSRKRRQSELEREAEEREQNISRNMHLLFDDIDIGGDTNEGGDDNDDDSDHGADNDHGDDDDQNQDVPFEHGDTSGAADNRPDAMDVDIAGPSGSSIQISQRSPTTAAASYEDLVRKRVEQMLREAEQEVPLGDLTERVREWESRIEPILAEDIDRRRFDVHEYGDDILEFFDASANTEEAPLGSSVPFVDLARTQPDWEVCRYFLTTLMLANTGNVELSTEGEEGTLECSDTLKMKLLSRERHHEQFEQLAAGPAVANGR